jgi:Protein of unknown function (DUF1376)/HNH endonuclease
MRARVISDGPYPHEARALMTKRPYMPLYVADYLSATEHLDAAESGAYLHLIMYYWQKGFLPPEDKFLARIARMTDRQWAAAKSVVMQEFVKLSDGFSDADRALGLGRDTWRDAIPTWMRFEVLGRDGLFCVYCGKIAEPLHLDHIIPWVRGGTNSVDNLCVACGPCNQSKGSKTLEEWMA